MKKRKKRVQSLLECFHTTCGWCGKFIPPDTEVFGSGAKVRPGVDLSGQAGQVLPLHLVGPDKTVLVAVPGLDSEAKREGWDLVYMTCSEACGRLLQAAFQEEIRRGKEWGLS